MTPLEQAASDVAEFNNLSIERGRRGDRAVLGALREPTEARVEKGAYCVPVGQGCEEGPLNVASARECWQAMIDASLGEE